MTCIVPNDLMYHQGFTFYTIGGNPEIVFYNKSQRIERSVISAAEDYVSVEDASLSYDSGTYRYTTRYNIKSALEARSAGTIVPYTIVNDGDIWYFEFTQYYPKLKVSYTVGAIGHYVEFPDIPGGEITMLVRNKNTGEFCDYELEGIDMDDLDTIPCKLDQYVPVNLVEKLSVPVSSVKGISFPYVKPDGAHATVSGDNFGIVKIWVDMDGDYIIDTSSAKKRTTVTLTANVNG